MAAMIFTTMTDQATRPSACPGLYRIVPAKDGGLCRLRVPLGRLTAAGARAVAEAAARHGNGIIEVTNRANLQLRGIRPTDETALAALLLGAGLGPRHPETDDVRNVMIAPTAGLDPRQHLDVRPLAEDLLRHLESDVACRVLSPKFSLLVDGGESVAVIDHPHDIWLAAIDHRKMALGIAGSPPTRPEDTAPFIVMPAADALAAATTAIALFLDEAADDLDIMRFRHLLGRVSRASFFDRLSKRLGLDANLGEKARRWRRAVPAALGHVGIRDQKQDGLAIVGAVPVLGRLSPDTLPRLGGLAATHGDGNLRLTPRQSVMVPGIRREKAGIVVEALEELGLICSPAHPLASTIACAGSSGCAKGRADTKADALLLADGLAVGPWVHLSGCERSCASARVAEVTLLAAAPGIYDLFVRDAGSGGRFGRAVAGNLGIEEARRHINDLAKVAAQ